MGLELSGRFQHEQLDAEVAQVRSGQVSINLMCPTDTGVGRPVPAPEERMSQVTFTVGNREALAALRDRLAEGGAAVVERGEDLFYIDSDLVKGLFGTDAAIVFCTEGADGGDTEAAAQQ